MYICYKKFLIPALVGVLAIIIAFSAELSFPASVGVLANLSASCSTI